MAVRVCLSHTEANVEFPNLRHLMYSIVLLVDQADESKLIDRIYLERFHLTYDIWLQMDNELNGREKPSRTFARPKASRDNANETKTQKISWNFISQCEKYEKIFGGLFHNLK